MLSFRNRLLILLIGLVVGAQIVTLVTALPSTYRNERDRADRQLVIGAERARAQLQQTEDQLATAVRVLTSDWALREPFAKGEWATMASALDNHAARIGADLTLALDLDGNLIGQSGDAQGGSVDEELIAAVAEEEAAYSDGARFLVAHAKAYQVFTSPVRVPDEIGRIALGFAVDQQLAHEMSELLGVDVAFLTGGPGARHIVASTVASQESGSLVPETELADEPTVIDVNGADYLATITPLETHGQLLDLALMKPMDEVMAPFRELAWIFAVIIGFTIIAAVVAGIYLGGSAARPVQQLAAGAERIAAGDYSSHVESGSGGRELANLARAFNTMQRGIAEREAQLRHQARHDGATRLPNRLYAEEWLAEWLARLGPEEQLGVVMVAIANLQEISASLGFEVAERLVQHLANDIGDIAGERTLVARLDATHFVVAATPLSNADLDVLMDDLRKRASRPLTTAGVTLQASVVLGAALAPLHGNHGTELLRCAEAALATALHQKHPVSVFERASDEAQRRALRLGADLPQALQSGQLYVHYQPKYRISDRVPRGVEALVRWKHPEFGNISPAEFIPIAERTGASGLVTRWVLREALAQLSRWQQQGVEIELAVNLSPVDIVDPGMLEFILGALRDSRLAATSLALEVTESVLLDEPEAARRNMELLRVAGVRFSIDDFGTGYSSLSQLRELAADELKIDQSFVRVITQGPEHVAVIRAIVELGRGLGLRTVAEGVETEEQWQLLAELGCDYVQGYLVGKPQAASDLTPRLLEAAATARAEAVTQTASLRVLDLRRKD